jgi:6-phosphogluconolactonase
MELSIVEDPISFANRAAEHVAEAARAAVEARGRFVLGLTGGSTPAPIHRALAAPERRDAIDWARVWIVFGDERAVPPDDARSNYGAARDALLSRVPIPASQVLRMRGEAGDLVEEARRYAEAFERDAGGTIDLLFVGLGRDAHVLSLFPGSPAIDQTRALVVAEIEPPMDPPVSRLTFTPAVFERAREVLAIATGAGKAAAARRAIHGNEPPRDCPARLLSGHPRLTWLLDREAAESLR